MGAKPAKSEKTIVVIGGGLCGSMMAQIADPLFNVILIEKRDAIIFKVGAPRGIVDPEFSSSCAIPNSNLLKHGKVIQDTVTEVNTTQKKVTTQSGQSFSYDYLVLAVGTQNCGPVEPNKNTRAEIVGQMKNCAEAIKAAESVIVIGGGLTGCEVAGEIRMLHPSKKITLVHSGKSLCDSMTQHEGFSSGAFTKFQSKLQGEITKQNIDLVLDDRATNISGADCPEGYKEVPELQLQSGKKLPGGLVVWCAGAKANTSFLKDNPAIKLNDNGNIIVDECCAVEGLNDVYAIGDGNSINNVKLSILGGSKKGGPAMMPTGQADTVLKSILNQKNTPWKIPKPSLIVPVGKSGAAMNLPSFLIKVKGKEFWVKDNWKRYAKQLPTSA